MFKSELYPSVTIPSQEQNSQPSNYRPIIYSYPTPYGYYPRPLHLWAGMPISFPFLAIPMNLTAQSSSETPELQNDEVESEVVQNGIEHRNDLNR